MERDSGIENLMLPTSKNMLNFTMLIKFYHKEQQENIVTFYMNEWNYIFASFKTFLLKH